ncbi:hypothetical protein E5161_17505 [Cohnella pontilimi]|uniref:Uncharacterized protein n=1 Tax=Cohnella pontilimi TaxID=2564100 RepID=A0A4U0F561_9BACL|nr:hypothetical protein [Cohnella pontilimi]TJY39745.1 hypothetical protein E5161_17505 [Cohnella pontilimi]
MKRKTGKASRGASHRKKETKRGVVRATSGKSRSRQRLRLKAVSSQDDAQAFEEAYRNGFDEGFLIGFEEGHQLAYEQPV